MQLPFTTRHRESGFSILEMMFATVILLVGLIAVAQLVPTSVLLNFRNRNDSAAMVFAQRELDQMLDQPLNPTTSPPQFTDAEGNTCYLGNPATTNAVQGNPVVTYNNQAVIDFSPAPVANYSFTYTDPTDPNRTTFDVRWAVILTGDGTHVFSKRFILGVRQQGGNGYFLPISLDTMKAKE